MRWIGILAFLVSTNFVHSQSNDPEFAPGLIIHARVHNGLVSSFNSSPDLYLGGIELVPQVTIIPSKLRAGIVAGGFYSFNKIQGLIGPTVSYKLKTFEAGIFGTAANLHVSLEQLWGTERQRLFGGGVYLDLLNMVVLGISTHRDYKLNNWWLQQSVAIRISKKKKIKEPFN